MNRSQRIHLSTTGTSATDKFIKFRLEQDVDTLEFLSMSISTKEIYQNFNADYGVLVGRVIANDGVGIPNAKISIFIPLATEDENSGEINSIYPYKTPRDKNNEGKRYNLLPRTSKKDVKTGVIKPPQPFGSFPIKEELVTNQPFLDIYKKYYKYTALSNDSGDYMIFGAPIGVQVVHMSVDITDIGEYSMTPAGMIVNLGYSPNLFNGTTIKPSNDLNDLPHIETQEITVNIVPFWGDSTNFDIGITRQDFKVRAKLVNTFVIFGSAFTDGSDVMWGHDYEDEHSAAALIKELYYINHGSGEQLHDLSTTTKRYGEVTEKIYYYPSNVSDYDIDNEIANPVDDMKILSNTDYSIYKKNGDFVFIINCNRNKVITDKNGIKTPVDDSFVGGVYTEFRGFITFEITNESVSLDVNSRVLGSKPSGPNVIVDAFRYKLKIPQCPDETNDPILGASFGMNSTEGFLSENIEGENEHCDGWRRKHKTFKNNKIYSISRYHGVTMNYTTLENDAFQWRSDNSKFLENDIVNGLALPNNGPWWGVGTIYTGDDIVGDIKPNFIYPDPSLPIFGAEWLNFSIYLPQVGWVSNEPASIWGFRSTTNFSKNVRDNFYYTDNNHQNIGAGVQNTVGYARSDIHMTDFIEVPVEDLKLMKIYFDLNPSVKNGFLSSNFNFYGGLSGGEYKKTTGGADTYFSAGIKNSNCVKYLFELGIL